MRARDRLAIGGLLVVLVVIGAALLAPQAAKPVASPTVAVSQVPYREGVLSHPSSINPLTPRSQADRDLIALLFRGLVREGPDGTLLPDLAASWDVADDGHTYTFQMRDDAFWEDGFHVTADDVAFTVGLLQDSRYTGPAGASWQGIKVKATGVYTVQMTMALANAGFLRLASQPLLPQHLLKGTLVTELGDSAYSQKPIGNGPFRILEIDYAHVLLGRVTSVVPPTTAGPTIAKPATARPSSSASVTPTPIVTPTPGKTATPLPGTSVTPAPTVPPTAAPTPPPTARPTPTPPPSATPVIDLSGKVLSTIGEMELDFYDDAAGAVSDFQAGKLDAVGNLPADQTAAAAATNGARVVPYQWANMVSVVLNQRPDHGELRDANARTGLLAAIDRPKLLSTVLGGRGSLTNLPIPAWSSDYDLGAAQAVPFSQSDAAQFLQDAGWAVSNGQWITDAEASPSAAPYSMTLLTPDQKSSPLLYAVGQFVADSWRAIGIGVTIEAVTTATYLSRLDTGDFDAAVASFEVGLEPDLSPLLLSSQIGSGGSNVSGVQDTTLDQLLNVARRTIDPVARPAALNALEQYLSTTVPILPLAYREYDMVVTGKVQKLLSNQISDPSARYWDVIDWRLANGR